MDDDKAGQTAVKRAVDDRVLKLLDVNLCTVPHLLEAELEDLYDISFYTPSFFAEFGVDLKKRPMGKAKQKWSSVTERLFKQAGKPWDDGVKTEVKNWLACFAAKHEAR